jgi:hypothetical protein
MSPPVAIFTMWCTSRARDPHGQNGCDSRNDALVLRHAAPYPRSVYVPYRAVCVVVCMRARMAACSAQWDVPRTNRPQPGTPHGFGVDHAISAFSVRTIEQQGADACTPCDRRGHHRPLRLPLRVQFRGGDAKVSDKSASCVCCLSRCAYSTYRTRGDRRE